MKASDPVEFSPPIAVKDLVREREVAKSKSAGEPIEAQTRDQAVISQRARILAETAPSKDKATQDALEKSAEKGRRGAKSKEPDSPRSEASNGTKVQFTRNLGEPEAPRAKSVRPKSREKNEDGSSRTGGSDETKVQFKRNLGEREAPQADSAAEGSKTDGAAKGSKGKASVAPSADSKAKKGRGDADGRTRASVAPRRGEKTGTTDGNPNPPRVVGDLLPQDGTSLINSKEAAFDVSRGRSPRGRSSSSDDARASSRPSPKAIKGSSRGDDDAPSSHVMTRAFDEVSHRSSRASGIK